MFISMQTILKNTDENLYFDRVRETFGLTRSEKISISPLTIEGNIMKHVSTIENSGKHTCDIHVIYEKVSDTELKMTNTIDDVTAIREFKKLPNKITILFELKLNSSIRFILDG